MAHAPDTQEMYGIVGAWNRNPLRYSANGPTIGSIIREWNAWLVGRSRAATPRRSSSSRRRSTAGTGPETTLSPGPFAAARQSSPSSRGMTSPSPSRTESIAPASSPRIIRRRAAMTARASSRERTPERHAATSSPTLCPIIARGVTPHRIQRRAKAYPMTKSDGCASPVSLRSPSPAPPAG